jgi:LysR family transcriptional regulator, benzoate and cis,cis-muconate-responsive activator of ben and cat genes
MPREYQYPFELRHLVYFRELARQLHFRRAAETLSVAQPALSRALAQLEAALGADLLNRTRRGAELTPAGRLLLERVEPLLRGLAALPRELQAHAEGEIGHIRVAFTGLAMATVLPAILREFHLQHPRIRLELNESPTAAQLPALQAGEFACGFFHPDAPTPGLHTRELLRERNGVLLPASHPLAGRTTLRLRELAATRIGLVRAGLGATFMTPSEAQHLPPEVTFRALIGPAPESRLVVGWRQPPPPDAALAAFLSVATIRSRSVPGKKSLRRRSRSAGGD